MLQLLRFLLILRQLFEEIDESLLVLLHGLENLSLKLPKA